MIFTYIYVYLRIYIYIRIHIHTHTHIYIFIYVIETELYFISVRQSIKKSCTKNQKCTSKLDFVHFNGVCENFQRKQLILLCRIPVYDGICVCLMLYERKLFVNLNYENYKHSLMFNRVMSSCLTLPLPRKFSNHFVQIFLGKHEMIKNCFPNFAFVNSA